MPARFKPKIVQHKPDRAPPGYEPRWVSVATVLRKLGASNEEIAEALGLTLADLNRRRKENPDFSAAWNVQSTLDAQVEQALFRRATGYTCERSKIFIRNGVPVIIVYEQHLPPNVRACEFWLINRRPDRWQQKPEPKPNMSISPLAELAEQLHNTGIKPVDPSVQAKPVGWNRAASTGEEK